MHRIFLLLLFLSTSSFALEHYQELSADMEQLNGYLTELPKYPIEIRKDINGPPPPDKSLEQVQIEDLYESIGTQKTQSIVDSKRKRNR